MVLVGTIKAPPLPPWAPASPAYSPTPAPQASPVKEAVAGTPAGEAPKVTEQQLQATYGQATTAAGRQVEAMPGYRALPKETKEAWYGYVLEQQMGSRGITFPSESAKAAAVATQLEPTVAGRVTSEPVSLKEAQKLLEGGGYVALQSAEGDITIVPMGPAEHAWAQAHPGGSTLTAGMYGAPTLQQYAEQYKPEYGPMLSISTEARAGVPTGVLGLRAPGAGLLAVGPEGAAYEYAPIGIEYGARRTREDLAKAFMDVRYGGIPGALRAAPTVTTAFDFMTGRERVLPPEYQYRRPFMDAMAEEVSKYAGVEPVAAPTPLLTYPYYYTEAGVKKYYRPEVEPEPEPGVPIWTRPGGAVWDPTAEAMRNVLLIEERGTAAERMRMRAELRRPPVTVEPGAVPEFYFTEISPGVKSYVHKVTTGDIDYGDFSHLMGSVIYGIPVVGEVLFKAAIPAAERIGALGVSIVPATIALTTMVPYTFGQKIITEGLPGAVGYAGGVAFGLGEYMYKGAEEWGRAAGPMAAFSSMFVDVFTILGGTGKAYAQLRGAPAPRAVGVRPKIEVVGVEPIGKNIRAYFKSRRVGEIEYPKLGRVGKPGAIWREFRTERQAFVEPAIREMVTAKKGPPTAVVTPEGRAIVTEVLGRGKGMSFGVMLKKAPESLKEVLIRKAKVEPPPERMVGDWYGQLMKSEIAKWPEKAPALEVIPGGLLEGLFYRFKRPPAKRFRPPLKEEITKPVTYRVGEQLEYVITERPGGYYRVSGPEGYLYAESPKGVIHRTKHGEPTVFARKGTPRFAKIKRIGSRFRRLKESAGIKIEGLRREFPREKYALKTQAERLENAMWELYRIDTKPKTIGKELARGIREFSLKDILKGPELLEDIAVVPRRGLYQTLFGRARIKPKAEILKEAEALEMFERYPEAELYEFWGEAMPAAAVRIVEAGIIRPPKPMLEIVGKELPKEVPGVYLEAWGFGKITEPPKYRVGALERLHLRRPTGVPEAKIVDRLRMLEPEVIGMKVPGEFVGSAEAFIQMTKKPKEPWMPPEKAPIRGGVILRETPESFRYIARGDMPVAGYRGEVVIKEFGEIIKYKGKVRFPEELKPPTKPEPLKVEVPPEGVTPKKMVEFVEPKFKTIEEQLKPTKPVKKDAPEKVVEVAMGKDTGVKMKMIEKVVEKPVERVLTAKEQKMISEAIMAKVALRPMTVPSPTPPRMMPLTVPLYKEEVKPRAVEMAKVKEALLPREALIIKERLITGPMFVTEQLQKARQVELLKMTEAVPIELTLLKTEPLQITKLREEELQKIREVEWAPAMTVTGWVPPPPPPVTGWPLLPRLPWGFQARKLTKKEKRLKRATKYQPSLIAQELGIRGKRPKIVTGLEIRPMRL